MDLLDDYQGLNMSRVISSERGILLGRQSSLFFDCRLKCRRIVT